MRPRLLILLSVLCVAQAVVLLWLWPRVSRISSRETAMGRVTSITLQPGERLVISAALSGFAVNVWNDKLGQPHVASTMQWEAHRFTSLYCWADPKRKMLQGGYMTHVNGVMNSSREWDDEGVATYKMVGPFPTARYFQRAALDWAETSTPPWHKS